MDMLIFGLSVTVVGMLIVFFGLVILIGLIKLITMMTSGEKPRKEAAAPAPVPAPAPVAVTPAAPEPVTPAQDDALIAVISAAIAAMMGEDKGFVVRRVRRVSNAPAWQKAGREEQVYSRF